MFFTGRNPDNNVPLANGKVLAWLQQYDGGRPVDKLSQLFYPNYDLTSRLLGEGGSTVLVKLAHERIWYDPYGLIKNHPGQVGEIISVDSAEFVEGSGVYQVVSHKGNAVVRTRTRAPPGSSALVRSIEVSTLRGEGALATLYPVVSLQNVAGRVSTIVLSRLNNNTWLAVTCTSANAVSSGDVARSVMEVQQAAFEHGSVPTSVTFSAARPVPEWGWSQPVYLVLALGGSKTKAVKEIKRMLASRDCFYSDTLAWWEPAQ